MISVTFSVSHNSSQVKYVTVPFLLQALPSKSHQSLSLLTKLICLMGLRPHLSCYVKVSNNQTQNAEQTQEF